MTIGNGGLASVPHLDTTQSATANLRIWSSTEWRSPTISRSRSGGATSTGSVTSAAQNATPSRAAPTGTACESSTSAATTESNPSWTHSSISVEARSSLSPCIDAKALLQRLAAVRGRLSLCADQAAAAKWWLSMPMASVSAEGPMPKALSTRRTSPLMPGCRHQGRACPLRRARMTSNPLIVA